MALWRSTPKQTASAVCLYGKAPWAADFIRSGALDPAGEAFIDWVERGLQVATARIGPLWKVLFETGGPQAFVFRPPSSVRCETVVVGMMIPSGDAIGRKFPLVACANLPVSTVLPYLHLIPLACGDFLDRCFGILRAIQSSRSALDLDGLTASIPLPRVEQFKAARDEYDAWARSVGTDRMWAALLGANTERRAQNTLGVLLAAIAPLRDHELPTTRLGVRLPLGIGGSAGATFWVDLLRRAARWRKTVPTAFWQPQAQSGVMLLQLGDPPEASLAELWAPDPESDYVCELSLPTVEVSQPLPAHILEFLVRPDVPVVHLLEMLER